MRYTLLIAIAVLSLSSCDKDKYNTIPTLKYEAANTTVVQSNQQLSFTLSFTDKEGDVADSIRVFKFDPKCAASTFGPNGALYKIPEFPAAKNQDGEIVITF